jgi:hypothetical protein
MKTTILVYVIAILGLVMIGTGAWSLFALFGERDRGSSVPHRDYAMAITMIAIGFGLGGIAQALRLMIFFLTSIPH